MSNQRLTNVLATDSVHSPLKATVMQVEEKRFARIGSGDPKSCFVERRITMSGPMEVKNLMRGKELFISILEWHTSKNGEGSLFQ